MPNGGLTRQPIHNPNYPIKIAKTEATSLCLGDCKWKLAGWWFVIVKEQTRLLRGGEITTTYEAAHGIWQATHYTLVFNFKGLG